MDRVQGKQAFFVIACVFRRVLFRAYHHHSITNTTKSPHCPPSDPVEPFHSSTVTMQMGIERVLKENFPNLGQVVQIDGGTGAEKPSELTVDMVMLEMNRIGPAISAMGENYGLVRVDPIGEVEVLLS